MTVREWGVLALASLLATVCSCGRTSPGVGGKRSPLAATSQPKSLRDADRHDVVRAPHKTEQWRRIVATLVETEEYYSIDRTWTNPAKASEERRMERMLSAALKDIRTLLDRGALSEPEAKLLELDVTRMPQVGNFGSRTIVIGSSKVHFDGLSYPPAWNSSSELAFRMPWLRKLAELAGRNQVTVRAAIESSQRHIEVLRSATGWWRSQAEKARGYVARIKANHGLK